MSAATDVRVAPPERATDQPEILHLVCCHEERTLCGMDSTDMPPGEDDEQPCVVCADLDDWATCPFGRPDCECE